MIVRRGFRQPPSYPHRPAAPGSERLHLRRDHQRLRRDAGLRGADRSRATAGRSWPTCGRCSSARTRRSTTCRAEARAQLSAGGAQMTAQPPTSRSPPICRASFAQWRRARRSWGSSALVLWRSGWFVSTRAVLPLVPVAYLFCVWRSRSDRSRWLMLQHVTGGAWGVVIRRPCEAAARTLPLLALLFLPIAARHARRSTTGRSRKRWRPTRILQHKAAVPERSVLPGARRALLRRLDAPVVVLQPLVGRQDRDGDPSRACAS